MKCIELIPGIKLCAEQSGSEVHVELDVQGHKVWGTTLRSDHKCTEARLSVPLIFSADFKVCFEGKRITFTGKVCLFGKCSELDVHLDLP